MSPRLSDLVSSVLFFVFAVAFVVFLASRADALTITEPIVLEAEDVTITYTPAWDTTDPIERWTPLVARHSWNVDYALSILQCESGGNPGAVSPTNDHGLFQHNARYGPARFADYGMDWSDRYDPATNIEAAYRLWRSEGWRPWTCHRILSGRSTVSTNPTVTIDIIMP